MLKKVFATAVLSVSALGTMAASANIYDPTISGPVSGPYITGQFGYANTHMGNKVLVEANSALGIDHPLSLSTDGPAARVGVGYQINPVLGVEFGFTQFDRKKLVVDKSDSSHHIVPVGTLSLNQNALDLLVKGSFQFPSNISVYGKIGVAYLTTLPRWQHTEDFEGKTVPVTFDLNDFAGIAKHKIAPEAVVGVEYLLTPNVAIGGSWTHIQPFGSHRPGTVDFVSGGVSYYFG